MEEQGLYVMNFEGDYSTPTIGDRECAYAIYDDHKVLKCAIEQAYLDSIIDWKTDLLPFIPDPDHEIR